MIYNKSTVTVLSPTRKVILCGFQEFTGIKLWRFSLLSGAHTGWHEDSQPPMHTSPAPEANSLYGMPSMEAHIRYLQAAAGFTVKSTCLAAIKDGSYASWPDLPCAHAEKYFPDADETNKVHMVQT